METRLFIQLLQGGEWKDSRLNPSNGYKSVYDLLDRLAEGVQSPINLPHRIIRRVVTLGDEVLISD